MPPPATDNPVLERMIAARQLLAADAAAFAEAHGPEGDVTEEGVLRWLAGEYACRFSELDGIEPERETLGLFPPRLLLKEEILPLRRVGAVVEAATSRLFAPEAFEGLRLVTGLTIRPVLAPSPAIQREMKKWLGVGADTIGTIEEEEGIQVVSEDDVDEGNLDEAAEDASIIRFVNQVLTDAVNLRASDIHLEPFEDELRLRYRIDGLLQDVPVPASLKRFQPAIVSRIKILSHLDIAEKRLPQDGRIKIRLEHQEVDVRVSLIPMIHGEGVVMRLLRQDRTLQRVADLAMASEAEETFRRLLVLPHGIILVTGPTGSGKSTTLYAALTEINDSVRKIITIEDPVEYHIKGINQIQVSEKTGLTFARGLRSILRHDPDVVLIGEIRDPETARIAVQASLTGHLVFSTLHTNDAPTAPTRLADMGVEPYLVASSLEGILAQRLVRVLCRECRVPDRSAASAAFKRQIGMDEGTEVFGPGGCEKCRRTGFHGRRGVFEMMRIDDELRELILRTNSAPELRGAARRKGVATLAEDGWRLVGLGVTSFDEVFRVSQSDAQYSSAAPAAGMG